ncbi:MAG: DUF177 domain-containing protein [Candidatus Omnitrophica bacterium]|nr:DUF177 domain-containing protein [Candidatus Omnitrophota bacterium]MBU1925640.1 DUF177 domain-containing protein [Candidatus Omnitrophota bacterium]
MKITINEIPVSGIVLEETNQAQILDLERTDIKFCAPVYMKACVIRDQDKIQIELKVKTEMLIVCSRCLEENKAVVDKEINIIRSKESDAVIDLTQIAREEIILDYPARALCRADCRGLCPKCGRNLNVANCDCSQQDTFKRGIDIEL